MGRLVPFTVAVVLASGCQGARPPNEAASPSHPAPSGESASPSHDHSSPPESLPATVSNEPYRPEIRPARFTTRIDNPYFPLSPGTTYVFEGVSAGAAETDTVTVTRRTKEILGVRCVVVRDEVRTGGELTELTFDWYAQDVDGNVWYFGEDSHEYSGGAAVSAYGSWEAGVDGAQPGIVMPGSPERGVTYRQEYRRGQAEDMAQVLRLDDSAKVPYGSFEAVLVTEDWSPLEPGVVERKYYAIGVGVVLETLVQGGEEVSRLVQIRS